MRSKLMDFMNDEHALTRGSLGLLRDELPFVELLINIYLDFLNQRTSLKHGETKYYYLCSVCKTQTLKACTNFLRLQISDGFSASRIASDAALYALLMSMDRLSESAYLHDQTARAAAIAQIGKDLQKGLKLPEILLAVRRVRSMHSPHAHADPIFYGNRIMQHDNGKCGYSDFQHLDDLDYRYFFMGMLWVGGMSLKAFLDIQMRVFDQDVSKFAERLENFKLGLLDHRRAIGVYPDSSNDEGF